MNRRGFLGSILAAASAPAIVSASSLMSISVPKLILPPKEMYTPMSAEDLFKSELYTGMNYQNKVDSFIGYAPSFILVKARDGSGWQQIAL